jgi:predicted RNA-binding Zn-ribbon protein involved in translation (DUF1610 family)
MAKYVLTCETEKCANEGVGIELETESTAFGCGACGEVITNKVEVDA